MKKKRTGQILNHSVGICPCGHSLDVRTSPSAETIGHLLTIIIIHQKQIKNKSDCIEEFFSDGRSKITLFCDYREKGDYEECFAISYLKRTLTIFHIKNDVEKQAVKYYNFDKSTNPK